MCVGVRLCGCVAQYLLECVKHITATKCDGECDSRGGGASHPAVCVVLCAAALIPRNRRGRQQRMETVVVVGAGQQEAAEGRARTRAQGSNSSSSSSFLLALRGETPLHSCSLLSSCCSIGRCAGSDATSHSHNTGAGSSLGGVHMGVSVRCLLQVCDPPVLSITTRSYLPSAANSVTCRHTHTCNTHVTHREATHTHVHTG